MSAFIDISQAEMAFNTKKGEFLALIGHSGCGKSTLLNLIAGLLTPTSGGLICDRREIAGPGPERAMVFQNHSLLPWLTCYQNVYLAAERAYGGYQDKDQLKARPEVALALVNMSQATASSWPRTLPPCTAARPCWTSSTPATAWRTSRRPERPPAPAELAQRLHLLQRPSVSCEAGGLPQRGSVGLRKRHRPFSTPCPHGRGAFFCAMPQIRAPKAIMGTHSHWPMLMLSACRSRN